MSHAWSAGSEAGSWHERFEHGLARIESIVGRSVTAVIVGGVLLFLAALYVTPATEPASHGIHYAQLSMDPWTADNPNAYRILTPLIAHWLHLRGGRILVLNLAMAWFFLALAYGYLRQTASSRLLAFGVAAALAFSMPTLFTIYYGGYTDSTTHLLVLAMMALHRRAVVFWVLFLLAMLNGESVLFLLPFFMVLQWQSDPRSTRYWSRWALGAAVAGALYLALRWQIGSAADVSHNVGYYLGPLSSDLFDWFLQCANRYALGLFSAFKLLWIIPLMGLVVCARSGQWIKAAAIAAAILGSAMQSMVAVDTSRMLALAFPALILGVAALHERMGTRRVAGLLLLLIGLNFLVPQFYVTSNNVTRMSSTLPSLLQRLGL